MSTAEAAARLGISPQRVRALWHSGALVGQLVAGRLLLDRTRVLDLEDEHRPATRPLSPRNAWTLLLMIAGETSSWASSSERSRLRRLVETRDEAALASLVRSRARSVRFDGVTGSRDYVLSADAVVPAGTTLAHRWTDLVVDGDTEAYTTGATAQLLTNRLRLWRDPRGPIVLHVIPDSLGVLLQERHEMPPPVIAVDLIESGDPRAHQAGVGLWQRSVEHWRVQGPTRPSPEAVSHG